MPSLQAAGAFLAGTVCQDYFFKHYQELGDSTIKNHGRFSQAEIDRRATTESERYRGLKSFIHAGWCRTRLFRGAQEAVIKGRGLAKEWRKPDVAAAAVFQRIRSGRTDHALSAA